MGGRWFGFSTVACLLLIIDAPDLLRAIKHSSAPTNVIFVHVEICVYLHKQHLFFSTCLCLTTIPAVPKPVFINTGSLLEHCCFNFSRGALYQTAIKCNSRCQDTRVLCENERPECPCKCTHVVDLVHWKRRNVTTSSHTAVVWVCV